MLYRSTDRLCRRGAPVKNLAHSASFESFDKDAPSKLGTKQLAYRHDLHRAAPIENIDHHLQPRAAQGDIDGRSIEGEIAQLNFAKKVRQHGSLGSDLRPVAVETEP